MPAALPPATALGRRLRAARLAKELTQAQLGELLFGEEDPNVAAPRVSRWERGLHKPDLNTIERLAKLLDLPAAYFVASSEVLAEAILLISQLNPRQQKQALALLRRLADDA
ncbi:helix-turn-helix transcriptional regulator [Luteimonas sp. SMYT11W]|uniref:Helix-turn-helix transcriptional regulator n=1 Tax=Luteimonas flava TaxID=3115822 RepID=A0ABU7WFK4_9GAMM